VDLTARVPGVIAHLGDDMDIGRSVKKDEVLLKLAVPDLDADLAFKKASLAQAEQQKKVAIAARTVAEREVEESEKDMARFKADVDLFTVRYNRISKLVKENAQDRMTQDEAYRQLQGAIATKDSNDVRTLKRKARIVSAREEITLAEKKIAAAKAEVDRLQAQVDFATIRAPFNGVITKRWVDPGETITGPTNKLLTVMQIDHVRVLIDVPQRDVPNLNDKEHNPNKDGQGDRVILHFPSLVDLLPRGELEGSITRVGRSLDPVTRTMRAEVVIPNQWVKGQFALRPGMYGSASVVVEDRSNVLSLPASALVRRGEAEVEVYQVAEPTGTGDERRGVLKPVKVVLGIDDGKEVEIREGLRGGELIVLRASGMLRPDEKVLAVSAREQDK
jgi:RND family efflux transporter MFP subunit